jgi:hypothetical protein
MSSLRDELLPVVDEARAIAGELGFRPYQVWLRTVKYSGTRVGEGTATVTEKRLLVGGKDPKVQIRKSADVVAGTPEFQEITYDVGPLTPQFAGGGTDINDIGPDNTGVPTEVFFVLKGPGLPSAGLLCRRFGDQVDRPLRYMIHLKSVGRKRP